MKFVHAADLHIDSPLRGLERYESAPVEQIRGATRRAFENLVALCLEEKAELLLLAGDLYDGNWNDYSTGLFFCENMAKLRAGGVKVVWLRGNHDAASRLTQHLRPPDNVHELPHTRAGTLELEVSGVSVAVHGQGFAKPRTTDDISRKYPKPIPGALNLGLLHTALDGREGHDPYAPCSAESLADKGYEYWALGHIHEREEVHREPWIVFPGNLQGRHARETGPKGATLVEASVGKIHSVEARALDTVRWTRVEVDATSAASGDDVIDLTREAMLRAIDDAEGRLVAARLVLRGATQAHDELARDSERWQNEARVSALDVGRGAAWIEKVVLRTASRADVSKLRERQDPVGALLRGLDELRGDDVALSLLSQELEELRKKLPRELLEGPDAPRWSEPEKMRELVADVEGLLLPLLENDEAG